MTEVTETPENNSDDPIGSTNQILCDRMSRLRKANKLTLDQLASISGVSRSMLSQIERGSANPTLAVTARIAQAFGISVGELVDPDWAGSQIEVVRGDDPHALFREDDECRIRTLSPLHMEKNVEFYEIHLKPGGKLPSAPHFSGTKELLTVTSGAALVQSGTNEHRLNAHDSALYRADVSHTIESVGDEPLQCYLVVTYES